MASSKLMILLNLLGSLIILSSNSWFTVWIGMELTSMTLPVLMVFDDQSLISKINSWKYYMVQCYSSSLFILSLSCMSFSSVSWTNSNFLWMIVILSMLYKMGIFPFHGWLFQQSMSISWKVFLILSTIQKIGPLIIIGEVFKNFQFSSDLILSLVISFLSIPGMMMNSIRFFMIISTMVNTAWILSSIQVGKYQFFLFMLMYFFHVTIIFLFFNNSFHFYLDSFFFDLNKSTSELVMKIIVFMSLIGMPPLLGFFMKLFVLEQMISMNENFSSLILIMISSVIMIMYLKLILSIMMNVKIESMQVKGNKFLSILVLLLFTGPLIFIC